MRQRLLPSLRTLARGQPAPRIHRRIPAGLILHARPLSSHTGGGRSLVQELQHRGLAESITGPDGSLDSLLKEEKCVVYAGVDATATSLHVGHLLPLLNLLHFLLRGHTAIVLVGKATAAVGDPSGRMTERDEMVAERLREQFAALWKQLERFYTTAQEYAVARGYKKEDLGKVEIVTNSDWLEGLGLIEFLGKVGRHVRVGPMLARDSVKGRMASAKGINFAEFTYQLLQSYDFWHLYQSKNCRIQVGGNDQYGNITAGIDLITRLSKNSEENTSSDRDLAYGLTVPLLTTPSGEKFGKSAGNAVWLDEKLTSSFELYQYFARLPDTVVEQYLRVFTLLPEEEAAKILDEHWKAPEKHTAQYALAREVVTMVHGAKSAANAAVQTQLLFPAQDAQPLSAKDILEAFEGSEKLVKIPKGELIGEKLVDALVKVKAVKARPEAKQVLKAGGVYVGQEGSKVTGMGATVEESWFLDGQVLLIRLGKGRFTVVHGQD